MEQELKNINEKLMKIKNDVELLKSIIWFENLEAIEMARLSEKSLSECWDSKEDEEAFAYLQ